MTLRAALAESCSHDTPTLEQHYPGRALTAAAVESSAARARDAEIAAFDVSGRMGGVLELFDGGTGRPVRFVIERGTVPSLLLDFKNTSARPVELRVYDSRQVDFVQGLPMAGVPSELVEDLENDFPRLMERQRCKICRGLFQGDGYTHAALSAKLCQSCAATVARPAEAIADDSATVFTTP